MYVHIFSFFFFSYASAFPALPPKGSPAAVSSGPPANSFWKQRAAHPKHSDPSSENKILVENNAAQQIPTSSRKFKSNGKENEMAPESRRKRSKDQHVKKDGVTSNGHSHKSEEMDRESMKKWYFDKARDYLLLMLRVKESDSRSAHSLPSYFQFAASDQTGEQEPVLQKGGNPAEESHSREELLVPEPVSNQAESKLCSRKQTWDLASSCSESRQSSNATPSFYPPFKPSASPDPPFSCVWDLVSDAAPSRGMQLSPSFTVPDTAAVYSPLCSDASTLWMEHPFSKPSSNLHDDSDAYHEIPCSAPLYASSMITSPPSPEQKSSVTHSFNYIAHLAQNIWARHSQSLDTEWPSPRRPFQLSLIHI